MNGLTMRRFGPALLAVLLCLCFGATSANATVDMGTGYGASAVTDRDGTTHVVSVNHVFEGDTVSYCRIPHGTETCADTKTFTNPCSLTEYQQSAPDIDPPKIMISPFGDVIVMTHGVCGTAPPGGSGETAPDSNIIWQSTDNGDTFTENPMAISRRSYASFSNTANSTWSSSVLDLAQRRIVSVFSVYAPYDTANPTYHGGVFVQGAPLGIVKTNDLARMTDDSDERTRNGGGDHPAIVQRGPGEFVVAWVDPDGKIALKQYEHPEDTTQTQINDASKWTALAGPSETNADQPHLVSGPLGTFLMYRYTPDPDAQFTKEWRIRRLEGSTLGAATKIPDPDFSVGGGFGTNSTWVANRLDANANLVEDQANGRLHFVRSLPGSEPGPPRNHVQYMTSDDGVGWSANEFLPRPDDQHRDLGPYGSFGNRGQSTDLDPWLGESTGAQGFGGLVGWSWQAYQNGYNYTFGDVTLPGTTPPTPVDPNPGGGDTGGGGTTTPPGDGGGATTPPAATPPPPTAPASPEDKRCRVLQMAALDVVADACFKMDGAVFVATGGVHVNGMDIAGAEIRFDPTKLRVSSTGPVNISVGKTSPVKLFSGAIDWAIPKGNIFDLGTIDVGKLGSTVFGFKFVGSADVKLVRGAVEIDGNVGLPKLLGGVTADLVLRSDNIASLHVRELKFAFKAAKLGPLDLADASLGFDPDGSLWSGSLKLSIPPGMQLAASIEFRDGTLTKLAGAFSPPAPGFPLDPFSVAYLTEIRASLEQDPLKLSGGLTIGAGPPLSETGSDRVVKVDGDLSVTLPDNAPVTIRADGVGSVMGIPIAKAYLQYVTDGHISAGASVNASFGPFTADGGFDGWFYHKAFNLEGHAEVCAGLCLGGRILFSSKGFAACAHALVADIGAGITWGDDLVLGLINPGYLITHLDLMPLGCDVGDYRAVSASAHSAQAGAERSVTFKAGLPSGVVGVIGQDGPPHVALVGPDGTRVEPEPNAPINTSKAYAFQSVPSRLTWFDVKAPKAGVWKIVPEADSTPITELRTADGLADPKVTAKVTRGAGRKEVLTYKIDPIPGQTVAFAEQGKGGLGAAIADVKAKTKGVITFMPTDGAGGTREIIAQVTQNGIPRKTLVIAHYTAPPPLRPAKPKLRIRRSGTKLVVSWPKDAQSKRFVVNASLSDGRVLVLLPKAPKATIAGVAKTVSATVVVHGEDHNGVAGPRATARLKGVKAKAKKKKGAKTRVAGARGAVWIA
ncbi:MAG: domain containing protein [Conexibacter sp.]|nr:domain containing protein [Conexibacter sp.]